MHRSSEPSQEKKALYALQNNFPGKNHLSLCQTIKFYSSIDFLNVFESAEPRHFSPFYVTKNPFFSSIGTEINNGKLT